jgi:formylmethanofuran dehydrogenase subunit E
MARLLDPEDFFEIEDRRLAKLEADAPHCDWCGEAMWEYYYLIGDDKVCDRCVEECRVDID